MSAIVVFFFGGGQMTGGGTCPTFVDCQVLNWNGELASLFGIYRLRQTVAYGLLSGRRTVFGEIYTP